MIGFFCSKVEKEDYFISYVFLEFMYHVIRNFERIFLNNHFSSPTIFILIYKIVIETKN